MEKSTVSSLITGLRPKVKQAVVQIIHKYARQIKACTKTIQNDNHKQRVSRMKEEILIMKNIHLDTVIKKALLMDFSEREKVLNNVHESLEMKVIVKLATHKSVKEHVNLFRKSSPDWQSSLPQLLESFGLQKKSRKKNINPSETQQKRDPQAKISLDSKSQTPFDEVLEGNSSIPSNMKKKQEIKKQKYKDSFSESDELGENKNCDNLDDDVSEKISMCQEEKLSVSNELQSGKLTYPNTSSAHTHAEVCLLSDLLQEETCTNSKKSQIEESHPSERANSKEDTFEEEDCFFFTKDNDFLKTKAVKTETTETVSDVSLTSRNTIGNRAQRRAAMLGRGNVKLKARSYKKVTNDVENSLKQTSGQSQRIKMPPSFSTDGEKLHPSWEAKRNQKISVGIFRGKKTTFDEVESRLRDPQLQSQKNLPSKNSSILQNVMREEKLHPSWEAKRKQSFGINSFQGKKVKFEDT